MYPSKSENNGLSYLTDKNVQVYSVGISTAGVAEMRMAKLHPKRHIIATTVDQEGARYTQKFLSDMGVSKQVTVKVEDVAKPLPYKSHYFDFIYARLSLHYLSKPKLMQALGELNRILKNDGKLFVVVRSLNCRELKNKKATFDPTLKLTTYTSQTGDLISRYFHTEKTFEESLLASGFNIEYIKSYEEQLCADFQRTQLSENLDSILETVAKK